MKPIIIIPPKTMSDADIKLLRENDLCVVVAENPAAVKFLDPIPAAGSRTKIEDAAIALSRKLMQKGTWNDATTANWIARVFTEILIKGTPLDPEPSDQEVEKRLFDGAKRDELIRLGKEEARAERAAAREAAKKKPTAPSPSSEGSTQSPRSPAAS